MSALTPKADIDRRHSTGAFGPLWSLADMVRRLNDVRFTAKADINCRLQSVRFVPIADIRRSRSAYQRRRRHSFTHEEPEVRIRTRHNRKDHGRLGWGFF